jgi:uncharacterized protein (TIGR03000 family)
MGGVVYSMVGLVLLARFNVPNFPDQKPVHEKTHLLTVGSIFLWLFQLRTRFQLFRRKIHPIFSILPKSVDSHLVQFYHLTQTERIFLVFHVPFFFQLTWDEEELHMYSLVLMTALTTGTTAPAWGHHCCGCSGWGGWACNGCYGCYGCYGGHGWRHGCYGCYGCYGGYGCYGCYGCYGGWYGGSPYAPIMVVPDKKGAEQGPEPKKKKAGEGDETRARLIVQLPADAKLFIDGTLMKSTSEKRTFITPVLRPEQTYFYDLRAEVVRDGRTVARTQRVILRPGQAIQASFSDLPAAVATAQAEE